MGRPDWGNWWKPWLDAGFTGYFLVVVWLGEICRGLDHIHLYPSPAWDSTWTDDNRCTTRRGLCFCFLSRKENAWLIDLYFFTSPSPARTVAQGKPLGSCNCILVVELQDHHYTLLEMTWTQGQLSTHSRAFGCWIITSSFGDNITVLLMFNYFYMHIFTRILHRVTVPRRIDVGCNTQDDRRHHFVCFLVIFEVINQPIFLTG